MGLLDELARYVGVSKDVLVTILLTLFVAVIPVWIGYVLAERSQHRSSIFDRRLDANKQLASLCEEIVLKHEILEEAKNPDVLPSCIYPSLIMDLKHPPKFVPVRSWDDVLRTPISKWIQIGKTKSMQSKEGLMGYRPLNFFYDVEYVEGPQQYTIPVFKFVHDQYERSIRIQGLEIFFSRAIREKALEIYAMARFPDKYPKTTTEAFIHSVKELRKCILDENSRIEVGIIARIRTQLDSFVRLRIVKWIRMRVQSKPLT